MMHDGTVWDSPFCSPPSLPPPPSIWHLPTTFRPLPPTLCHPPPAPNTRSVSPSPPCLGLPHTIIRPGPLEDGPATGTAVVTESPTGYGGIVRADLAALLVGAAASPLAAGKTFTAVDRTKYVGGRGTPLSKRRRQGEEGAAVAPATYAWMWRAPANPVGARATTGDAPAGSRRGRSRARRPRRAVACGSAAAAGTVADGSGGGLTPPRVAGTGSAWRRRGV